MAINPSALFIAAAPCGISHMKIGLFCQNHPRPPNLPRGSCPVSTLPMWGAGIPAPSQPTFPILVPLSGHVLTARGFQRWRRMRIAERRGEHWAGSGLSFPSESVGCDFLIKNGIFTSVQFFLTIQNIFLLANCCCQGPFLPCWDFGLLVLLLMGVSRLPLVSRTLGHSRHLENPVFLWEL